MKNGLEKEIGIGTEEVGGGNELVMYFSNGRSLVIDFAGDANLRDSAPVGLAWVAPMSAGNVGRYDCTPLFTNASHNNLFGRMMTLLEAILPEKTQREAVKSLMSKELGEFSNQLHMKVVYASKNSEGNPIGGEDI